MTTPTREQVSAWVEQADAYASSQTSDFQEHGEIAAERLCALAMSAGRDQGLREAKEVCEQNAKRWPDLRGFYVANECAAAIEQLRASA